MAKLRDDQVADLAFYISQKKCLNLSDPGAGKTPSVCVNQYQREGRTVWVQPKVLMPKNQLEIVRFTPLTLRDVAIVDGTPKQVDDAMNSGAKVFLMGPDRFKRVWADLPADVTALDVDEFHMCFSGAGTRVTFEGPQPSARVEAFYAAQSRFDQGVFMTGTLINGRLDTAYPAIHAIEPNYYPFGYEQFLGAHAYLDEYGRPIDWYNHQRLAEIFARHGIRRTFEEVHGKQEVYKEVQWLRMNDKQRALYDEFAEQAYLELEEFFINGDQPGVATIRARQIMEHPNHFRDLRDPYNLPHIDICPGERPSKLDALEIHLEDHNRRGTPVIIGAALIPQMEQIVDLARSMGRRVGLINGDTSARDKNEYDEGFRAGRYDTLVISPPTAGVGFNWQFCGDKEVDHVIFASLTYKDSDYEQMYKRAIRGARSRPLRVTTLGYIDSVDIRLMTILERKSRDAHLVDPTRELLKFVTEEG